MPITNKRFVIRTDKAGPELLDTIDTFFREALPLGAHVIRFACVDRTARGLVVDATILSTLPAGRKGR